MHIHLSECIIYSRMLYFIYLNSASLDLLRTYLMEWSYLPLKRLFSLYLVQYTRIFHSHFPLKRPSEIQLQIQNIVLLLKAINGTIVVTYKERTSLTFFKVMIIRFVIFETESRFTNFFFFFFFFCIWYSYWFKLTNRAEFFFTLYFNTPLNFIQVNVIRESQIYSLNTVNKI